MNPPFMELLPSFLSTGIAVADADGVDFFLEDGWLLAVGPLQYRIIVLWLASHPSPSSSSA